MSIKNAEKLKESIALAISIEPTGWGIGGLVSRKRDHSDKTLQDYIYVGYEISEVMIRYAFSFKGNPGKGFFETVKKSMELKRTNMSFGTLFLIYFNVHGFVTSKSFSGVSALAEKAISLIYTMDPKYYFDALKVVGSSFIGRYSSSLMPSILDSEFIFRPRINWRLIDYLKLNIFDPVASEVVNGFSASINMSKELLRARKCSVPNSNDIDYLLRHFCCKKIDYLSYRKLGIDKAEQCSRTCCTEGNAPEICPLGSLADLVALTLFYYFVECLLGGRFV